MDRKPVHRVGVVAAPDLRRVIQHSGIEPSAASAAAFEQDIRILLYQPLHKVVQAYHVIIKDVTLRIGRMRVNVGDRPVAVPFNIFYVALVENLAHPVVHIVDYLFSREIEHELIPSPHRLVARNGHRPVRVLAVKFAVLAYHLRLEPDTELNADFVNLLYQLAQTHAELFLVRSPVAERPVVVAPVAEPAVVHDEHVGAEVLRLLCEREQRLTRKVKE